MSKFINSNGLIDPMSDVIKSANDVKLIRPMQFEAKDKSFEEKTYIILYTLNHIDEEDPSSRTFSVCIGRTMAYSDIKNKILSGLDVDVHRSCVLTETKQTETNTGDIKYFMIPYNESISVYAFCISVAGFYSDDEFNIEEYSDGDVPENNTHNTNFVMTPEQITYRNLLEESLNRDRFINDMIKVYGNDDSNNV